MRQGLSRHVVGWVIACAIGAAVAVIKHVVADDSVASAAFDGVLVAAAGVIAVEILAAVWGGERSVRHFFLGSRR